MTSQSDPGVSKEPNADGMYPPSSSSRRETIPFDASRVRRVPKLMWDDDEEISYVAPPKFETQDWDYEYNGWKLMGADVGNDDDDNRTLGSASMSISDEPKDDLEYQKEAFWHDSSNPGDGTHQESWEAPPTTSYDPVWYLPEHQYSFPENHESYSYAGYAYQAPQWHAPIETESLQPFQTISYDTLKEYFEVPQALKEMWNPHVSKELKSGERGNDAPIDDADVAPDAKARPGPGKRSLRNSLRKAKKQERDAAEREHRLQKSFGTLIDAAVEAANAHGDANEGAIPPFRKSKRRRGRGRETTPVPDMPAEQEPEQPKFSLTYEDFPPLPSSR